jgi:uncharacterized protein (DUF2249 family)/hemerythrin-like domain-containing protein
MSTVRDSIHQHHTELAERLAAHVDALEQQPEDDLEALVAFLKDDLLPHAQGEEAHLYPAVDPLIAQHGSPTATMRIDHQFISAYVQRLQETAREWARAPREERPALMRQAARLALQLQALLGVHLEKEETVYLPLFERYLSAAQQQRILDAMHEAPASADTSAGEPLDVRLLPPAQRHARIFDRFDALAPGASFILINDHDPKPLRYQLLAERPGQLGWEYLEQGPEVWRVCLSKTGAGIAEPAHAPADPADSVTTH